MEYGRQGYGYQPTYDESEQQRQGYGIRPDYGDMENPRQGYRTGYEYDEQGQSATPWAEPSERQGYEEDGYHRGPSRHKEQAGIYGDLTESGEVVIDQGHESLPEGSSARQQFGRTGRKSGAGGREHIYGNNVYGDVTYMDREEGKPPQISSAPYNSGPPDAYSAQQERPPSHGQYVQKEGAYSGGYSSQKPSWNELPSYGAQYKEPTAAQGGHVRQEWGESYQEERPYQSPGQRYGEEGGYVKPGRWDPERRQEADYGGGSPYQATEAEGLYSDQQRRPSAYQSEDHQEASYDQRRRPQGGSGGGYGGGYGGRSGGGYGGGYGGGDEGRSSGYGYGEMSGYEQEGVRTNSRRQPYGNEETY